MKFVAFLRGINVGGNKPVKMDKLREAFASLGFKGVRTILASGNVLFEAEAADTAALAQKIEKKLAESFGHPIGVIVRTFEDLKKMHESEPFGKMKVTPEIMLYVTFLAEKSKPKLQGYASPDGSFKILKMNGTEAFSMRYLSHQGKTPDMMALLEKEFGKVTTRNWNTIEKILNA
ncbi:MAG: DUF1697 domain-containing protein [Candidatus Micrarchaeota archaeon]